MALSAKRLGSPSQQAQARSAPQSPTVTVPPSSEDYVVPSQPAPNSPAHNVPGAATLPPNAQDAAMQEIDSLIKNLLSADGGKDGISLNETLIPQAAKAEAETADESAFGGFILPEKKNRDSAAGNVSLPTVEISAPRMPESTVKIPLPPPPSTPAAAPTPAPPPVLPKEAKRTAETWKPKSTATTTKPAKPSAKVTSTHSTATGNQKKKSELPAFIAVVILIILIIAIGYVVWAHVLPVFSETDNTAQPPAEKQAKHEESGKLVILSETDDVLKAVEERNAVEELQATPEVTAELHAAGPAETTETTASATTEDVAPSAASTPTPPAASPAAEIPATASSSAKPKKNNAQEEIIDIPYDDDEMPLEYQPMPWPEILVSAVIAKGKNGDGLATINGETLKVGDETASGIKLISVAVNPPRAVLRFDGREQTVLVSHKSE